MSADDKHTCKCAGSPASSHDTCGCPSCGKQYDDPLFQPLTDVPMDRQVYELNEALAELQKQLDWTMKSLEECQNARAKLWDALAAVESSDTSGGEYMSQCPSCGGAALSAVRHLSWCELKQALALGDGRVK